jgi:hypothetical protein
MPKHGYLNLHHCTEIRYARKDSWLESKVVNLHNGSGSRVFPVCVVAVMLMGAVAPPDANLDAANRFASGRVLRVGPGEVFSKPSEAAAAALAGDTIMIASGTYSDCAIWPRRAPFLTIQAAGGVVVIKGRTCEYKALFVIKGDGITVRGITFTGAQAPRHNGAGIRAEGRGLLVENSRFVDNEEGILAGSIPNGTIVARNSVFEGNGNCIEACAHGIYVGNIAELRIETSNFLEQQIGHHVKSRAARTVLNGNTIMDGPFGTASYLVDIPNGGALIMRNNILQKGPLSDNPRVAVILGEEGATNVTSEIVIEDNQFTNDLATETFFVHNYTTTSAILRGNKLSGPVNLLAGPGTVDAEVGKMVR